MPASGEGMVRPEELASRPKLSVIVKMCAGRVGGEAGRAVCPTLHGPRLGHLLLPFMSVFYFAVSGPEFPALIYASNMHP